MRVTSGKPTPAATPRARHEAGAAAIVAARRRRSRGHRRRAATAIRSRCSACTGSGDDIVVRAFIPGAERVEALTLDGTAVGGSRAAASTAGFFEGRAPRAPAAIGCAPRTGTRRGRMDDPYAFGPVLGPLDDYCIGEGTHLRLFDKLGAHAITHEGEAGVHFAVWAPNARRVSVVGDFNAWDGRRHAMRMRRDTGRVGDLHARPRRGTLYKYEIVGRATATLLPLKADPFALRLGAAARDRVGGAQRPGISPGPTRRIGLLARRDRDPRRTPMSIYEVHAGSWRRGERAVPDWDELAERADPLCRRHGLHAYRAHADHRASARRVLGLPADRALRADRPLRRSRRIRALRRPAPPGGASA